MKTLQDRQNTKGKSNMKTKPIRNFVVVLGLFGQTLGTLAAAVASSVSTSSGEVINATQLLDRYAATQDRLRSCWIQEEEKEDTTAAGQGQVPKGTGFAEIERWVDGRRYAYRRCMWGNVGMGEFLARDRATWVIRIWDGETFYQYDKAEQAPIGRYPGGLHFTRYRTNPEEGRQLHDGRGYTQLSGYFAGGDHLRLDATLRQAASLSMRSKPEIIGGSPCLVLEAHEPTGR